MKNSESERPFFSATGRSAAYALRVEKRNTLYREGPCFFSKEEHSEKTPSPAKEIYSIVWSHHWCGYTERQSPLTNILMGDMSNLKISEAHALENSSIPLLPDIPDHIQ
jgi:hypothetical protein